jgi:hypothetical protein
MLQQVGRFEVQYRIAPLTIPSPLFCPELSLLLPSWWWSWCAIAIVDVEPNANIATVAITTCWLRTFGLFWLFCFGCTDAYVPPLRCTSCLFFRVDEIKSKTIGDYVAFSLQKVYFNLLLNTNNFATCSRILLAGEIIGLGLNKVLFFLSKHKIFTIYTNYHFPTESWINTWLSAAPDYFPFSIKVNRYITDHTRLKVEKALQLCTNLVKRFTG